MHGNAAYAPQVHFFLSAGFIQLIETGAKQIDNEIVPLAVHARRPQGGHALATLQKRIDVLLVVVCGTLVVDVLDLEGHDLACVYILGTKDRAWAGVSRDCDGGARLA